MLSYENSKKIGREISEWLDQGIISMADQVAYSDALAAKNLILADESVQLKAVELYRRYTEAQHGSE
jgi:uncharacterized membrane protein